MYLLVHARIKVHAKVNVNKRAQGISLVYTIDMLPIVCFTVFNFNALE